LFGPFRRVGNRRDGVVLGKKLLNQFANHSLLRFNSGCKMAYRTEHYLNVAGWKSVIINAAILL